MVHLRRFSLTLVAITIFGLLGSIRTLGQTTRYVRSTVRPPLAEGGRLTNSSPESKTFPKGTSAGRQTLQSTVRGTCDPRPPKSSMRISSLMRELRVELPRLGIVVQPLTKDLVLHKFWLEIYAGQKLVFKTLPDCTGCSKTYKGLVPSRSIPSGYVFTLDEEARTLAGKFFVPENRIILKVSGHNGVLTSFYVVRVEP